MAIFQMLAALKNTSTAGSSSCLEPVEGGMH
jgi:hypothetical protein